MKVLIDLDPADIQRLKEQAARENTTPGELVRQQLAYRRTALDYRDRVRGLVLAGACDADIAGELGRTPGEIARVRRAAGLPANPRYRRNT